MTRGAGNIVLIGSTALGGHPDAAGVPDAQQPAVRVSRRRPRCRRAEDARRFRRGRGRRAGPHLQRQPGLEEADDRRGRGLPGPQPPEPGRRARRRRDRGGPRGAGGRRLRGVGGSGRARSGGDRAGRAGGLELAHRELSRIPDGRLGPGPREQRTPAGPEVRRGARRGADGGWRSSATAGPTGSASAPGSAWRRGRS